jgi:uncharacterized protein
MRPVIRRTFQMIPGVGPWREKDLWARGLLTWDDFAKSTEVILSDRVDPIARERIQETHAAIEAGDLAALAKRIPAREHWRLYPLFADDAVFFDIEADAEHRPTIVSLFDRDGLHVFVDGRNLDDVPAALAKRRFWVTFNGSVFDVPVLQRHFGALALPDLHLDLRFLCRRVRLKGGLKDIEDSLGLGRPPHLRGVRGMDAILLWRAYQRTGDVQALRFLAEYNLYDSINLRAVLDRAYNRAAEHLAFDDRVPEFDRGDVLYDVSKLLLGLAPTPRDLRVLDRIRQLQEL